MKCSVHPYLDCSPDKSPDIDPKTKAAIIKLKDALKKSRELAVGASNNNTTTVSECDLSHIPAVTPGSSHQMTFSAKSTIQNSTLKNWEKALPTEGNQPCPKCGNVFKKYAKRTSRRPS